MTYRRYKNKKHMHFIHISPLILLAFICLVVLAGCSMHPLKGLFADSNRFTEKELKDIHVQESSLASRISDTTWHYSDDPGSAVIFHSNGDFERINGGVTGIEYAPGKLTWEIRFCGTAEAETDYIITDKEKALQHYRYNVVIHDPEADGSKTYAVRLEMYEDGILFGDKQLYPGADFVYAMPDDLIDNSYMQFKVWYREDSREYLLFYKNGYALAVHGVESGKVTDPFIYQWGCKRRDMYIMNYRDRGGVIVQDIGVYVMNEIEGGYLLRNKWNGKETHLWEVTLDGGTGSTLRGMYEPLYRDMVFPAVNGN